MDNEELKIYTYVDGINDTPFPNLVEQAKIKKIYGGSADYFKED